MKILAIACAALLALTPGTYVTKGVYADEDKIEVEKESYIVANDDVTTSYDYDFGAYTDFTKAYYKAESQQHDALPGEEINVDENFAFIPGASVDKTDVSVLKFTLQLNGAELLKRNYTGRSEFNFTLNRAVNDGATANEICEYKIIISNGFGLVAFKQLRFPVEEYFTCANYVKYELEEAREDSGYTVLAEFDTTDNSLALSSEQTLDFYIKTSGSATGYFITFDYKIEEYKKEGWWIFAKDVTHTRAKGATTSRLVSVYDALDVMNTRGEMVLEENFEYSSTVYETAHAIAVNLTYEDVLVEYLAQIGDSPIAYRAQAYVNVSVQSQRLNRAEVFGVIGTDGKVFGHSMCEGFTYDATRNIYVADYGTDIAVRVMYANGYEATHTADVNTSFADFYGAHVQTGALPQNIYDYMYSQLVNEYIDLDVIAEVGELTAKDIYAYWGFFTIPKGYGVSDIIADFAGYGTLYDSAVYNFKFTHAVDTATYQRALDAGNYGWVDVIMSHLGNFFTQKNALVENSLIIFDPTVNDAVISKTGSTEEGSSALGTFFTDVGEWFAGILGDPGALLTFIAYFVVAIALIAFVVWVVFKLIKSGRKTLGKTKTKTKAPKSSKTKTKTTSKPKVKGKTSSKTAKTPKTKAPKTKKK